jgi:uncharacterized protein YjcR
MASRYPQQTIDTAKLLFLKKHSPAEIKDILKLNSDRIVRYWIEKNNWEQMLSHETVEQAISRRVCILAERDKKSPGELEEMDRLINQLDKLAGVEKKKAQALQIKQAPEGGSSRNGKKREKKPKNDISEITAEQLEKIRKELFFEYQHTWHKAKSFRKRFILKSRQIGATYYFAWEAFEDAILSGDNQVFLSASRAQAEIFKAYIIGFAKHYFDIELKGDTIVLSNGAELRFLSTNARTAQGYHGHLYVDEVFWMQSFDKVNEVAAGIASQKKWRTTYFSTPSIKSHSAYPLWSGEWFNKARKRKKKLEIDITPKALRDGKECADGVWRNVVTVVDAQRQGCDLFDITQLRNERPEAVFQNLFMCEFRQEGDGVFSLDKLLDCGVDSNVVWVDFKKKALRPYGDIPVWVGYDPARRGDKSIVAVVAPPLKAGGKYRLLEWVTLTGSYIHQAEMIKVITEKYNVQYLGIDSTGTGHGVYEMVKKFYRGTKAIHYGMNTKTELVLKAQDVIEGGRIEWDASDMSIPQSFMQIRQVVTKSSDQITYAADRTAENGHADVAWSIMHALHNEPLSGMRRKSSLAMSS